MGSSVAWRAETLAKTKSSGSWRRHGGLSASSPALRRSAGAKPGRLLRNAFVEVLGASGRSKCRPPGGVRTVSRTLDMHGVSSRPYPTIGTAPLTDGIRDTRATAKRHDPRRCSPGCSWTATT